MPLKLFRLWLCGVSVILALAGLTLALGVVKGASSLTRLTIASPQGTSLFNTRQSRYPSMSTDGTKIAFVSDSDFFHQGVVTGQNEIWLFNTTSMTLTRVSTASGSNRFSFGPALSPNGNKLAFHSNSDFFGQGNTQSEIWLYDTLTLTLTRITTASASNRDSASPSLNEDGTKIAFYSDSDFLNQGIPDDQFEVWVYDLVSKTYTRVTTASDSSRDSGFNNLFGNGVHISPNGKKIVFSSDSDFLNQGILDNQHEIWLYDLPTSHLTRVTTTSDTSRYVGTFSLNKDGTKIALMSDSDYLSQGILQSRFEIWLYSTANMTLTRITTTTGSGTHRDSYDPALNYDGTKIVFASSSDFLNQGIPDGQSEIWLYNTQTMTYTRITTGMGNGIRASYFPSPSANGEKIAFNTDADFFNQGIITNQLEIWLYDSGNQILPTYKAYFPLILKQAP